MHHGSCGRIFGNHAVRLGEDDVRHGELLSSGGTKVAGCKLQVASWGGLRLALFAYRRRTLLRLVSDTAAVRRPMHSG